MMSDAFFLRQVELRYVGTSSWRCPVDRNTGPGV